MNTKWNGRTFSLENFTNFHQSSFVQFQQAAEHIAFRLPTEHTCVGYFLDNIQNKYPNICADIASIHINVNGMRDNFETTAAVLFPMDPYAKQINNSNKNAHIFYMNIKGKFQRNTGVYIFQYEKDEYKKLTKDQRAKFYSCQKSKYRKYITNQQRQSSGKPPNVT